jgi:hypothetical protein
VLNALGRGTAFPTNLYAALVTSATAPNADTNVLSDLTEIAAGNGYTSGGIQITRDATGVPTSSEDDTNDLAKLIFKNLVWTASGAFPASGSGARYLVITDDNATVGSRQVLAFFDLGSSIVLASGQSLTLTGAEMRITE